MKRLQILMVASEFPPFGAGIGFSVREQALALQKAGHDVVIITRAKGLRSKERFDHKLRIIEVTFIPLPPPLHVLFHGYFVNRTISKLSNSYNFDLIHLHSPLVPVPSIDLPLVVTVHSTWKAEKKSFENIRDKYSLYVKLFAPAFCWLENRTFRSAQQLTTTSGSMKRELTEGYGSVSSRLAIVPNIVDLNQFKVSKKFETKKYDAISVSRLVYRKGLLDLIEAVKYIQKKLPTFKLVIIGSGPLETRLRKTINSYGIQDTVLLVGHVDHKKLNDWLTDSKIFISASLYEPFGLTTIEAMAAGLPVAATKIGGSVDLVKDNYGLLFSPHNPQQLAKAITALINNPDLSKLGKFARDSIIKRFEAKFVTKQLLEAYKNVI